MVTFSVQGEERGRSASNVLFVSPLEVKSGRLVAEIHCAKCHGMSGERVMKKTPYLASQHADYLFSQLLMFQNGKRMFEGGGHSLISLNEDALKNVSAYYSMQDLSMVKRDRRKTGKNITTDPLMAGEIASKICESCHGKTGNGTFSGMPRLTGKHQIYLVSAIKAYKTGTRQDAMMREAAASLSANDIENLALYYASQKPVAGVFAVNGNAAEGRALSGACGGCHGEIGHSPTGDVPSLAGQDPAYLIKAINGYKNGSRIHEVMQLAVETLTEKTIRSIAAFYAEQTAKAPSIIQPPTKTQLVGKCDYCHGINGNSVDRFIPSISGQNEDYLVSTLMAYKNATRRSSIMQAMIEPLRDVDIDVLAKYYSRKNRRAVVFIDQKCD